MNPFLVRQQFPALARIESGRPAVYLDAPGGTQVPRMVLEAIEQYLVCSNANQHGPFPTSRRTDETLDGARGALADLLGASSPSEIAFGPNMTSLTFTLSRSIARRLGPGGQVVVTRLDHDANVTPWVLAARDAGAEVRWVDIRPDDCTLDMESLAEALSGNPKLVAIGYASNAVGTINDVARIVAMARQAGALTFVDAVQFAPHGVIDVQALGCDFLACSMYKLYGPHVGVLYGRHDLLESLEAYKVRPADDRPPAKFETGTPNFEGIAGARAAVEYLAQSAAAPAPGNGRPGRERLVAGLSKLCEYERQLTTRLLDGLSRIRGVKVWGLRDTARVHQRVPTVAITMERRRPREAAERLAQRGFYLWDGHFYALELVDRLGLASSGGFLRIGLAHYNTAEEVDALLGEIARLA